MRFGSPPRRTRDARGTRPLFTRPSSRYIRSRYEKITRPTPRAETPKAYRETSSSSGNSQPFSQAALEAVHFSVVGFVVVSCQMNHAVENQDSHFNGQGTRKRRALRRAVSGEIAMSPIYSTPCGGERHLRGKKAHPWALAFCERSR